jgi:DNA adenine methylase
MHFDIRGRARPVLKWAGGKSALLEQLLPLFPVQFDRYIEPFLGGAAVFLSLKKSLPAVVNELNPELFNLYCVIRDQPLELSQLLRQRAQQYSKDFYYQLRSETPADPIERAARTVFLNKTGFNGLYRQNQRGLFNVPFGHRKKCPSLCTLENLHRVGERFSAAQLLNSDFESVLAQAGKGDFVYCDPPYEPLSATSSFNSYTGRGFGRAEQQRLLNACISAVERGASVAVSNSTAPFVIELYSEWDIRKIKARRAINSAAQKRGAIEEVLVLMNV